MTFKRAHVNDFFKSWDTGSWEDHDWPKWTSKVSHNIEILHLSDSNKFENEINKKMEKKIEHMEPTLGTINLGNDENLRLIKIGSTINEKEKKDIQELLIEFQEIFA